MKFKKTTLATIIASLSTSFSVAYASSDALPDKYISEAPVVGKIYDEFLFYDNDGSKDISIQGSVTGQVNQYFFNKGALLDASNGGHHSTILVHNWGTYPQNNPDCYKTKSEFNIGSGYDFYIKRYDTTGAFEVQEGATLVINNGNIVLESGVANNFDLDSSESIINMQDGGKLLINSESLWMGNKREDMDNAGGINIYGDSERDNVTSKLDISLTKTFIEDNVAFGIAAQAWTANDKTEVSVKADEGISINAFYSDADKVKAFRGAGIYLLAYHDETALTSINLESEKGNISVTAQGYGYYGYGNIASNLSAKNIFLTSTDSYGIYGNGFFGEKSHNLNISAIENLIITSHLDGIRTFDSINTINAENISISSDSMGLYFANKSESTLSANHLLSVNAQNTGLYTKESSTNTFNASNIHISGNYALFTKDRAQTTLTASEKIELLGNEYGISANNSDVSLTANDILLSAENGWAICLFQGSTVKTITASKTLKVFGQVYSSASTVAMETETLLTNGLIRSLDGGSIKLISQNATLNNQNDPQSDLMKSDGNGSSIQVNAQNLSMKGTIHAINEGSIDISGSSVVTFIGASNLSSNSDGTVLPKGKLNLSLEKNSIWQLTQNSELTTLNANGTTLDFSGWSTPETDNSIASYRKLETNSYSGENNTYKMKIDLGQESKNNILTDQFNITGQALGTHTADLKIDGKDLVPNKFHSENWLISQGADSNMSILNKEGKNQYSGRGMVTTWGLAFVANGEEDKLNTAEGLAQLVGNTTGKGEGKWYLVRNDEEIVNPNPNPGPDPKPDPKPEQPKPNDPAEMQQITNLGISATQALSFASELEDLRGRLGEVRYGAQDGAWVRAGYAKETADGYNGRGFDQKTHDLHIGLDRIVAADEDSSWLVGGALRYAKSKQEGFTAARGGEGELEQYSAKLYATYMHAQGSYADFVVQAGRYSQDLTGLANDLSSAFKADYKTYGYGASVEIGHMFDFNNQVDDRQWFNHFFIEPQLQLSYFNAHGKDYKTSTGLAVSQSDADFLTGRAGVVVGKKFNYGTADDLDKRYFQVGLKGGVKYEFLGDQTIRFTGVERVTKERKADDVDGARYYYGVTADWQLSHNFRAYATVEREEGDHYTKDFDVSVGVKYQF